MEDDKCLKGPIVLIGYMGSGKSTVARIISEKTDYEKYDTDEEIVKAYGPITDIFSMYGEKRFREIETEILIEALKSEKRIIATGGGVVVSEKNREILKESKATVVFLSSDLEFLWSRIKNSKKRPLASNKEEFFKRFEARKEIYPLACDIEVNLAGRTSEEVANELMEILDL